MTNKKLYCLIGSCIAFAFAACSNADTDKKYLVEGRAVLDLELLDHSSNKMVLGVVFHPVDGNNLPRILDLRLNYDASALVFESHEIGAAVIDAAKNLSVRNQPDQGKLRIVVMGGNHANAIDAGVLVALTFSRSGSATGLVSFETGHQVAAPANAVRQITYGPAIVF